MYFQRIGLGFDGTGGGKYADMPCIGVMVPMHSAVGRITPSTRRVGSFDWGKFICWMVRSALADAVLQANITSGQPNAKSLFTA